jgi:actin related protein 2/3 complex, subunit 5
MDTSFRKINIDALEEDQVLPSDLYEPDTRGPQKILEDAMWKSGQVRGLVSR